MSAPTEMLLSPASLPNEDGALMDVVSGSSGSSSVHFSSASDSYVVGCYSSLEAAREEANTHVKYRGGKYGCEVVACAMDKIAHDGNVTAQAHYAESPYFGLGGQNSPACQPADRTKPLFKQNDKLSDLSANEKNV